MPIKLTDIGANVAVRAGTPVVVLAGGAADNVAQVGPWIDRRPLTDTGLPDFSPRIEGAYESAVLCFVIDCTLAAATTVTFDAKVRTATTSGGAGASDYNSVTFPAAVVATGPGGGGRVIAVARVNVSFNLSTANQFVGYTFTANISTGSVDTITVTPLWVFGGSDVLPVV